MILNISFSIWFCGFILCKASFPLTLKCFKLVAILKAFKRKRIEIYQNSLILVVRDLLPVIIDVSDLRRMKLKTDCDHQKYNLDWFRTVLRSYLLTLLDMQKRKVYKFDSPFEHISICDNKKSCFLSR